MFVTHTKIGDLQARNRVRGLGVCVVEALMLDEDHADGGYRRVACDVESDLEDWL